MYLTELYNFYQRMCQDANSGMAPEGMTSTSIHFVLVLSEEGKLVRIRDLRDSNARPTRVVVPAAVSRTSNISSNFCWDRSSYVIGVDIRKEQLIKTPQEHAAFRDFHHTRLQSCNSRHAKALLAFLDSWDTEQLKNWSEYPAIAGKFIVFQLEGEDGFLHDAPAIRKLWGEIWTEVISGKDCPVAQCCVTGKTGPIAHSHPVIKGVPGSLPSGARLISFGLPGFETLHKEAGLSAPVSIRAAHGYATALNYLLMREHGHTISLGPDTLVFWTEDTSSPQILNCLFDGMEGKKQIASPKLKRSIQEVLLSGRLPGDFLEVDPGQRWFLLGLTAQGSRLTVTFWESGRLGELLLRYSRWYHDLSIERRFSTDPEFPVLWDMILELAPKDKTKGFAAVLCRKILQSILTRRPWPYSMFATALQRISIDGMVTYYRAALIKAYLCNKGGGGASFTLDTEELNTGYRLGRLFAVLEMAQEDALGKCLNPLHESCISSASSMPGNIFPMLLKQAHIHSGKTDRMHCGYDKFFRRLVREIWGEETPFPNWLSQEDRGRFCLGYYHQRNKMYQRKLENNTTCERSCS